MKFSMDKKLSWSDWQSLTSTLTVFQKQAVNAEKPSEPLHDLQ